MPALSCTSSSLGSSSLRSNYSVGGTSSYSTKPPISSTSHFSLPLSYRSRSSYDLTSHRTYSPSLVSSSLRLSSGSGSSVSSSSSGYSTLGYNSGSNGGHTNLSTSAVGSNGHGSYSRSSLASNNSSSSASSASSSNSVTLTRYNPRKSSLDYNDNSVSSSTNGGSTLSSTLSSTTTTNDLPTTNKYSSTSSYLYSPLSRRKNTYSLSEESPAAVNTTSSSLTNCVTPSNKKPPQLCGLTNLGNTCYMNSVLQALFATEALRDYVLDNQRTQLMSSLGRLFDEMKSTSTTVASPGYFRTQFVKYQPKFRGYDQQDAQEFLRYLINGLHEEINEAKPRNGRKPFDTPKVPDEAWQQYKAIDDSPLIELLAGQLSSTVACSACGNTSTCWDPFWDLSLPLPREGRDCDIERCLKEFTALEELDFDEKCVCEKCKRPVRSTKRLGFERAPSILILHLKRFSNDGYKLSQPWLQANQRLFIKSKSYSLYACVCHHGSSSRSGHYTAYCQHEGRWFHFNDEKVTEKSSFSPAADLADCYILFYVESNYSSRL